MASLGLCSLPGAVLTVRVNDPKAAPVADAAVSLVPLGSHPSAAAAVSTPPLEIEQRGQEFAPYVTVVQTGTSIRLPNRDTVQHHVYSEAAAKRFELPLYAPGKAETLVFDRPGIVPLGCNIHDWMVAYVVVVDTPWFGRTGPDGSTTIRDLPPGKYRVEVWHPRLAKPDSREIEVGSDPAPPAVAFSLALRPDRRIRRPVEAGRTGYR